MRRPGEFHQPVTHGKRQQLAEWRTSKRSSSAVETLLTFWPPGPDARMKRSSRSALVDVDAAQ